MLNTIFATKMGMTQAWSKTGKRLVVTRLKVEDNCVLNQSQQLVVNKNKGSYPREKALIFEIGYGKKKLKNISKPLKEKIKKSGFSNGVKQIRGVKFFLESEQQAPLVAGDIISLDKVLAVGDVVKVQGKSKGRGFAGVIKRHGFHGGPRTHGQSDRERAPGSIGAGTDPGRVWKGKKMPGHYGAKNKTVLNLLVLYVDQENNELWVNGPVPGHNTAIVRVEKTGQKKQVELDKKASGIVEPEITKIELETATVEPEKAGSKPEVAKKKEASKKAAK